MDGVPLICGGYNYFYYTDQCYGYQNGTWMEARQLSEEKYYMASTMTRDGTWWVTGGYDGLGYLDTIEVFTPRSGAVFRERTRILARAI